MAERDKVRWRRLCAFFFSFFFAFFFSLRSFFLLCSFFLSISGFHGIFEIISSPTMSPSLKSLPSKPHLTVTPALLSIWKKEEFKIKKHTYLSIQKIFCSPKACHVFLIIFIVYTSYLPFQLFINSLYFCCFFEVLFFLSLLIFYIHIFGLKMGTAIFYFFCLFTVALH